jgi:hypothetical protein
MNVTTKHRQQIKDLYSLILSFLLKMERTYEQKLLSFKIIYKSQRY